MLDLILGSYILAKTYFIKPEVIRPKPYEKPYIPKKENKIIIEKAAILEHKLEDLLNYKK